MNITQTITIQQPIDTLWDLIANQFDKAYLWMGPIPRSVALGAGNSQIGAPMEGRLCDLSHNPNGPKAKEIITLFNAQEKRLAFDVFPVNNPAIIPIKKNRVQMSLKAVDDQKTEVTWTASPQLKPLAYLFYPLLRMILPLAFGKLLRELKTYAEQSLSKTQTSNTVQTSGTTNASPKGRTATTAT